MSGTLTTRQIRFLIENGRDKEIPEDDLKLYCENLEKRDGIIPEGIKNLYIAICHKAVDDHKRARRYIASGKKLHLKEAEGTRDETERFFGSEFFQMVSHSSKEKTMKAIDQSMRRDAQQKLAI